MCSSLIKPESEESPYSGKKNQRPRALFSLFSFIPRYNLSFARNNHRQLFSSSHQLSKLLSLLSFKAPTTLPNLLHFSIVFSFFSFFFLSSVLRSTRRPPTHSASTESRFFLTYIVKFSDISLALYPDIIVGIKTDCYLSKSVFWAQDPLTRVCNLVSV